MSVTPRARPERMALALALALWFAAGPATAEESVAVGAKAFTESYLLGEIMAQLLEARGLAVERRFGLEGTMVCFEALRGGEIDVYPEYSGTIAGVILELDPGSSPPLDALGANVERRFPVRLLEPFGFDNSYGIAVSGEVAVRRGLTRIGDLASHPDLRVRFSHEFLQRSDGWPRVRNRYRLPFEAGGIEHGLAYRAIADGALDVTDVYTTDGDIERFGLVILQDDLDVFPTYLALPLASKTLDPAAAVALRELAGRIDAVRMRRLNARVVVDGLGYPEVATRFLLEQGLITEEDVRSRKRASTRFDRLISRALRHLELTGIALALAILVALPAGVLAFLVPRIGRPALAVTAILQTVPSIALLALMIPLLGIGAAPAVAALFLYALLPIVRNTASGLQSVDPVLRDVATGMGLTTAQRLFRVELPLASPTILAGVRTATVISIGTATLAAFIGAGGLGEPIVTGLALRNTRMILEGAIPAALLAVITEIAFELVERRVVPRYLRRS